MAAQFLEVGNGERSRGNPKGMWGSSHGKTITPKTRNGRGRMRHEVKCNELQVCKMC